MVSELNRRDFLKASVAFGVAGAVSPARATELEEGLRATGMPVPTADAMVLIWLPGGVPHNDFWDPKSYVSYKAGMTAAEILGTCPAIPTSADGILLGEGLESLAEVMHLGSIVKSLSSDHGFSFDHVRAQHHAITGYPFPAGFKAPSMGSFIARTLGRRKDDVPAYIDIARSVTPEGTQGEEVAKFINAFHGPGFFGVEHGPFIIPDPDRGIETLNAAAGVGETQMGRRLAYLHAVTGMSPRNLLKTGKVSDYMTVIDGARAMMDSSVRDAFKYREQESKQTLDSYDVDHEFGWGCLLARRLVEAGSRFVEVEFPYRPFGYMDTHNDGAKRNADLKRMINRPIAQLIKDLNERGLLERTLIVIMSEFGRTIAGKTGFASAAGGVVGGNIREYTTGKEIIIGAENMYGFHGHFPRCNPVLFFGGGVKGGYVHGETADEHPMVAVNNIVTIEDIHATIYNAMGIATDVFYLTEERPVYATRDAKGKPIHDIMA